MNSRTVAIPNCSGHKGVIFIFICPLDCVLQSSYTYKPGPEIFRKYLASFAMRLVGKMGTKIAA
jgi:hypothetical protein